MGPSRRYARSQHAGLVTLIPYRRQNDACVSPPLPYAATASRLSSGVNCRGRDALRDARLGRLGASPAIPPVPNARRHAHSVAALTPRALHHGRIPWPLALNARSALARYSGA